MISKVILDGKEVEQCAPKKESFQMGKITADHIQRILINPFYAIQVAPWLVAHHVPSVSDEEWIRANAVLMQEIGPKQWLTLLLQVLQKETPGDNDLVNPYNAIHIDPMYALDHPPVYSEEQWIQMNVMRLNETGPEQWLRLFLDVLEGDFVAASDIDLAAPSRLEDTVHFHGKRHRGKKRKK